MNEPIRELLYNRFRAKYPKGDPIAQKQFSLEIHESRIEEYLELFSSKK